MIAFIRKYFGWLFTLFVKLVDRIRWKQTNSLSDEDLNKIEELLANDYYLICVRSSNHLSTWLISLGNWILTRKFGFYSHCLMNLENDAFAPNDFRLVEATLRKGVAYNSFADVFANVDSVALLKPKTFTIENWTKVMDGARKYAGREYDTLYDFTRANKVSCIELICVALMEDPNFLINYENFDRALKKYHELTPQMLYDCPDFEVVFEIRNK